MVKMAKGVQKRNSEQRKKGGKLVLEFTGVCGGSAGSTRSILQG